MNATASITTSSPSLLARQPHGNFSQALTASLLQDPGRYTCRSHQYTPLPLVQTALPRHPSPIAHMRCTLTEKPSSGSFSSGSVANCPSTCDRSRMTGDGSHMPDASVYSPPTRAMISRSSVPAVARISHSCSVTRSPIRAGLPSRRRARTRPRRVPATSGLRSYRSPFLVESDGQTAACAGPYPVEGCRAGRVDIARLQLLRGDV